MLNIKSKISWLLIFCCLFICISCVSASDADNLTAGGDVGIFDENYDFQNLSSTDVCSVENTSCLKSCSVEIGTFEELNNDLQKLRQGEVYNFEKDYCLKDNDFFHMNSKGPIICADNVIINGNGHVIDGANHSIALNVNADNVTVCNLTIINSVDGNNVTVDNFHYKYSPVVWNGDGGLILDCKFINNTGLVGGVIRWNGNNGLIDLCTFINNTATAVGGAIFLKGSNNVILNSIFFNSTSLLSGESIFFDHICKNDTVVNGYFNGNGTYAICGKDVQIDPEIFFYSSSHTYLADQYFDLVPLIYKSLINNGSAIYIDNRTSYYSEYNGTDFLFTLNRVYNLNTYVDDVLKTNGRREAVLSNTFHFKGISSFYDIYDNLFYSGGNCKREYNWVMDYLITGPDCYKVAMDLSKSAFDFFDSFK
ncbi:hypothetical protein [uncultured Methanobrevibacter sp.]|uniref:hypothetical protein n=1 Tax=uncultured Methanobrevibacter sp. TaxID=253161 RepID=UPI0025E7A70E|nr:hypothetical protein [uncultured Methanobrevibacter sp.]